MSVSPLVASPNCPGPCKDKTSVRPARPARLNCWTLDFFRLASPAAQQPSSPPTGWARWGRGLGRRGDGERYGSTEYGVESERREGEHGPLWQTGAAAPLPYSSAAAAATAAAAPVSHFNPPTPPPSTCPMRRGAGEPSITYMRKMLGAANQCKPVRDGSCRTAWAARARRGRGESLPPFSSRSTRLPAGQRLNGGGRTQISARARRRRLVADKREVAAS